MNFVHGQLAPNAAGPNRPGSTIPPSQTPNAAPPQLNPNIPVSNLESLRFKANQIIDSIQALQQMIELGAYHNQMPSWPDVLTKYNILLSQTHSFSVSLAGSTGSSNVASGSQANSNIPGLGGRSGNAQASGSGGSGNILERIVLHPSVSMPDTQLEAEVIPLLRNQQTNDVLRAENDTVRRLSEHMVTRGSVGVLTPQSSTNPPGFGTGFGGREKKPVEYEDVLRECEEIKSEHDRRVDRAVRAVAMLRERFEWKQRVEVEVEEPEELEWDPRTQPGLESKDDGADTEGGDEEMDDDDESDSDGKGDDGSSPGTGGALNGGDTNMEEEEEEGSDGDENEVQAMVDSAMEIQTPPATATTANSGQGNMIIDIDAVP